MQGNTKREQFFTTALQLFHEKGFKATTMRNIAERMSFDVANIYNYIDNKQSLLETYLFGISQEFHNGVDNILASSYNAKEKLNMHKYFRESKLFFWHKRQIFLEVTKCLCDEKFCPTKILSDFFLFDKDLARKELDL